MEWKSAFFVLFSSSLDMKIKLLKGGRTILLLTETYFPYNLVLLHQLPYPYSFCVHIYVSGNLCDQIGMVSAPWAVFLQKVGPFPAIRLDLKDGTRERTFSLQYPLKWSFLKKIMGHKGSA